MSFYHYHQHQPDISSVKKNPKNTVQEKIMYCIWPKDLKSAPVQTRLFADLNLFALHENSYGFSQYPCQRALELQMRSVFPRAARIWISNEHKLQPRRFTSHGKWEAVCAPGWALVHPSSPVLPPGRHSNVEAEQSVRPRSCVNDTLSCVQLILQLQSSAGRKLCGDCSSPLLHSLPHTRDQFLLPEAGHRSCLWDHASLWAGKNELLSFPGDHAHSMTHSGPSSS